MSGPAARSHSVPQIPNRVQTHYFIQALVIYHVFLIPIALHFVLPWSGYDIFVYQGQAFAVFPLQNGSDRQ
jgi:hypothetical protein